MVWVRFAKCWNDKFSCKMWHFWLDNVQIAAWISGLGGPFCVWKNEKNDFCWAWENFFPPNLRPKASVPLLGLVHWPGPQALAWLGPANLNSPQFDPLWSWMWKSANPTETHIPPSWGKPFLVFEFLNQIEWKNPPKKNPTNKNNGCQRDTWYPCRPLPKRRKKKLPRWIGLVAKHILHFCLIFVWFFLSTLSNTDFCFLFWFRRLPLGQEFQRKHITAAGYALMYSVGIWKGFHLCNMEFPP